MAKIVNLKRINNEGLEEIVYPITSVDAIVGYEGNESIPSNVATKEDLNTKQDTLVSGTNIKTINGESVLGSGDLVVTADLSDCVKKSLFIDTQIGEDVTTEEYDGSTLVTNSFSATDDLRLVLGYLLDNDGVLATQIDSMSTSGVTSIGGKSGDITLDDSTASGYIKFIMTDEGKLRGQNNGVLSINVASEQEDGSLSSATPEKNITLYESGSDLNNGNVYFYKDLSLGNVTGKVVGWDLVNELIDKVSEMQTTIDTLNASIEKSVYLSSPDLDPLTEGTEFLITMEQFNALYEAKHIYLAYEYGDCISIQTFRNGTQLEMQFLLDENISTITLNSFEDLGYAKGTVSTVKAVIY